MEAFLEFVQKYPFIVILLAVLITIVILSILPFLKKMKFNKVKLPGGIELEMDNSQNKEKSKSAISESDSKLLSLQCNDVKRLLETCINDTIDKCEKKNQVLLKIQEKKEEIIENVLNTIKPKIKISYNKRLDSENNSQLVFFLFSKTIEYNFSQVLFPMITKIVNSKKLEEMSNDDLTDLYKDIIKKTENCLSKISEEYIEANINQIIDIEKIEKSIEEYADLKILLKRLRHILFNTLRNLKI